MTNATDINQSTRPLDGIRVVEFGGWLAGPLAGKLLADLGAEVTRIAPPGALRLFAALDAELSAPKAVRTLDLREQAARDEALELIGQADVAIDNARPGAMARLGIDPDKLCELHPRLIWLSLPGFSSDDPELRDVAAWEGVLSAACGLFTDISLTRGLVGMPPTYTSLPLASVYGAVHGALGVSAALIARERDGVGDRLEVPLAASLLSAMGSMLLRTDTAPERYAVPPVPAGVARFIARLRQRVARAPPRIQEAVASAARLVVPPLMDSYRCADGRLLYVFGVDHDRIPVALLEAVGVLEQVREAGLTDSDLYGPARRDNILDATTLAPPARIRLRRALRKAFATRGAAEWEALLAAAGVPSSVQRTSAEWAAMPEVRQAGLMVERDGMLVPGVPVWLDEPKPVSAPAPSEGTAGKLPLAGMRVVDLSSVVAGPTAGRTLAELGAEVVKLDAPRPHHGPRMMCWFGMDLNRGKRSVLLNLREASGAAAGRALIGEADVVVENIRPNVLRDLGLDPEQMRADHPGLTWCSLGAYSGPDGGPWAERHGYDPVLQAATGVMLRYGGGEPEIHGVASCVDALTGYLASLGAVASLLSRARGMGSRHAHTSLAAAAQLAQLPFMLFPQDGSGDGAATSRRRGRPGQTIADGRRATGTSALQRLYQASDGWLFLGATPQQTAAVAAAVGARWGAHEPADDDRLATALAEAIQELTCAHAVQAIRGAGGGAHAVTSLAVLRQSSRDNGEHKTLQIIRDQSHPVGTAVEIIAPTYLRSRRLGLLSPGAAAPKLGSNTREVLSGLVGQEHAEALIAQRAAAEQITEEYLPA